MIERIIEKQINDGLGSGKVVIIYGPRQVGKTTLVKQLIAKSTSGGKYFNCDEPDIRALFSDQTSTAMRAAIGEHNLIVLDEAQRVRNIGLALKLLIDTYPELRIMATGSSAFELADRITEPLTGRNLVCQLFPLSEQELMVTCDPVEMRRTLESRILYGTYPDIVLAEGNLSKGKRIKRIASDYLFKDILNLEQIKKSSSLEKLLQALALQIGSEVSMNELATLVGLDKVTVARYIEVLEKAFIIFRLPPFSRNLRKELAKLNKIYFFDLGIRNSLINNFNPLAVRADAGVMWENYVIAERMKFNVNSERMVNSYFWRTYDQQEIDLVEDGGGVISGFEIKSKSKKYQPPAAFLQAYPGSEVKLITPDNYGDYVGARKGGDK